MKLKLSQITLDASTQSRSKVDQITVERYAQQISDGKTLPPLVVFGDSNILADGWHRYHALEMLGRDEVEVLHEAGGAREATFFAMSANNHHGLPMSEQDAKRNAERLLMDPEWSKMSDRMIADKTGISDTTVLRIRHALQKAGKVEPKTSTTYDRKGKEVVMPAPTPKEAPASVKQVEPKEDFSRPQDLQQIKELTDLVGDLEAENQRLKDVVAIGAWDATDIEKEDIEETVKDLREQIASLEREVRTLQASRDTYMNEVVELQRINKGLRNKLKQYE